MDFNIKGSDTWESDAFQEKFITDYFGDRSTNSAEHDVGLNKATKKKRKSSSSAADNSDFCKQIKLSDSPTVTKKQSITERLMSFSNQGTSLPSSPVRNSNFIGQHQNKRAQNDYNIKKTNTKLLKSTGDNSDFYEQSKISDSTTVARNKSIIDRLVSFSNQGTSLPSPPVRNSNSSSQHKTSQSDYNTKKTNNKKIKSYKKTNSFTLANKHADNLKDTSIDSAKNSDETFEPRENKIENGTKVQKTKSGKLIHKIKDAVTRTNSINSKKQKKNQDDLISYDNNEDTHTQKDEEIILKNTFDNENARSNLLTEKARKNLQAAKFRLLNEKMYTVPGQEAKQYFTENESHFHEYHQGYEMQVKKWPVNPVNLIIKELFQTSPELVIADLGCGDAKIAQAFPKRKIHSYDLVALNKHVTCCDISKVPLPNGTVDIAVFCLSLMGINLKDYIFEAFRILKNGGTLKIAEVESRIEELKMFIKSIEAYGFSLLKKDISHKMFLLLDFQKVKKSLKKSKLAPINLNPCMYKKR